MPMKLRLKLMAIIRPHFTNAEREFFDDVVNEINRVCLRVFFIDFEGADPGCIINRCVLETAYFLTAFSIEGQELNVDLDMMAPLSWFASKPLPGSGTPVSDTAWCATYASASLLAVD